MVEVVALDVVVVIFVVRVVSDSADIADAIMFVTVVMIEAEVDVVVFVGFNVVEVRSVVRVFVVAVCVDNM